jgi:hypothetical protein
MMYEVWAEGYVATGESGGATLLGRAEAETFAEACALVAKTLSQPDLFDPDRLTYWSCKLFDNRHDAQRSYG